MPMKTASDPNTRRKQKPNAPETREAVRAMKVLMRAMTPNDPAQVQLTTYNGLGILYRRDKQKIKTRGGAGETGIFISAVFF